MKILGLTGMFFKILENLKTIADELVKNPDILF